MIENEITLLPQPRELSLSGSAVQLPEGGLVVAPQEVAFSAERLREALRNSTGGDWKVAAVGDASIHLRLGDGGPTHEQGYNLLISAEGVEINAREPAGLFYGVATLIQLIDQFGRQLPALQCQDWPDYNARGVMLDISRDKVPTMETLFDLVDMLSAWKVNQFQLYTEHTFAYRRHRTVWRDASPMTAEEIRALDAYCRERYVELVPNQNSFGHMRRWLVHESYRGLAECPYGCDTDLGPFDEPFTLNPGHPGSMELLCELYDELLPNFSSRQFNVGCDETFDLGQGASKARAEEVGVGRVYLDFLLQIYEQVKARGRTMQFWGDVIMNHPELAAELPRDLLALEWGYEAWHPFSEHAAMLAAAEIPFYVCPGTSSWNTVAGRTDNAMGNLRNAAESGLAHGAIGYLNTDWGDNGHWQPLPVSYLGYAYGAAVSWAYEANVDLDLPRALDRFAFRDRANVMGQLASELGRIHENVGIERPNSTILFAILQASPEVMGNMIQLGGDDLADRLHMTIDRIDGVMARRPVADMVEPAGTLIGREYAWVGAMLRHACRRFLWALGKGETSELAQDAERLLTEHSDIWHARNRPGGFQESQARLEAMASAYR
jgi:hypothetical protein